MMRASDTPGVCRDLTVVLVRPTRYDEDGYVVRHWLGTLPSNTLSCLNGLTDDAVARGALGSVGLEVLSFDECVDRVDPQRLGRRLRRPGTRVLVALAGVQTNQFPRAQDLARQFKAEGFDVMIGGFHVSGSIAMASAMPPDCQALIDEGVTLVLGEVEERWADLLNDAAAGRLRPLYDFLSDLPDLAAHPLPKPPARLQRKFAAQGYGTIDAGRGCPFTCSFCTIVTVQGHRMRSRSAASIVEHVRAQFRGGRRSGIRHYFFTDDNFARNPQWEAIFDGLIALQTRERIAIQFMIQVDTQATRIPRFVEKAAQAGCVQVFIGMESLHDDNLKAAGKRQNKVGGYRDAIARWHEAGILCHAGFIIGFPYDTYARAMEDVRTLADEILLDQASFFMLTPLPGSRDHRAAVDAGVWMDSDYNNFDSFHPTTRHPRMSGEEWTAAYRDAWKEFYSFERMRRALLRQNPHTYWGMFKCFLWYRASMIEGTHPMVTGFFRLKHRQSRRPALGFESRLQFLRRRVRDIACAARGYAALALEMQELWRSTRIRRREYAFVGDLRELRKATGTMLDLKRNWMRLHAALAARLPDPGAGRGGARRRLSATVLERLEALRESAAGRADPPVAAPGAQASAAGDQAGTIRRRAPGDPLGRRRWRPNPLAAGWQMARDLTTLVVFFRALLTERF